MTLVLVTALGLAGCSPSVPERTLGVEASISLPEDVAVGGPIGIVYRWDPGDSFETPTSDYMVFVHILGSEGEIISQDDHDPPVPTSQWRVGNTQEYRRWLRLPRSGQSDYVGVRIGLYDQVGKVAVRWEGEWETDSPVHWLRLTDHGYRGDPKPGEGWHRLQRSRKDGQVWHWTREAATAYFENPRRDSVLHLEARSPVPRIGRPQQVRLFLSGTEIASLTISDYVRFRESIPVSSQALGSGDLVELRIEVDLTYIPSEIDPGSSDERVLGLQVYDLYLTER